MTTTRQHTLLSLVKIMTLIPACIFLIVGGFSWLFGSNVITVLVVWFIFVPFATFWLSKVFGVTKLWQSMLALLCFYAWMIYGIYDHYASDYFAVMVLSLLYNVFIFILVMLSGKDDKPKTAH